MKRAWGWLKEQWLFRFAVLYVSLCFFLAVAAMATGVEWQTPAMEFGIGLWMGLMLMMLMETGDLYREVKKLARAVRVDHTDSAPSGAVGAGEPAGRDRFAA